jgi:GTPase SAR1 family protein
MGQTDKPEKLEKLDNTNTTDNYDERFNVIYDMLSGSVIRGIVFSVYDKYGPQTLYAFPLPVDQTVDGFGIPREELIFKKIEKSKELSSGKLADLKQEDKLLQTFTQRDYLQIAIKSVSLLIGEKIFEKDPSLLNLSFFGVLPYPDLDVSAYTFFRFYSHIDSKEPKAITFSLLIDNNRRNYIYENIRFLKIIITESVDKMVYFMANKRWSVDGIDKESSIQINDVVIDFFMKIKLAENRPYTPIASKHKIKILFVGLKHSGKSSFLLTINRKYSEIVQRDSNQGSDIHIANMLGTTIVNWDIGQDTDLPASFKNKAEIYLYDSNLIYFFVDGTNNDSIDESTKWFEIILKSLKKNVIDIPIIIIITKVDSDISEKPEIRKIISSIKSKLSSVALKYMKNFSFFEISMFEISSVLSAFSNGINILSPNKDISEYKLHEYSKKINASGIMLFNENGLVIAQYVNDPEFDLRHTYPLKHVIETLGPQYINIFKNIEIEKGFLNANPEKPKWAIFHSQNKDTPITLENIVFRTKVDDTLHIIIKRMQISDLNIYVVMLLKDPFVSDTVLNESIQNLMKDFTEILQVYIM